MESEEYLRAYLPSNGAKETTPESAASGESAPGFRYKSLTGWLCVPLKKGKPMPSSSPSIKGDTLLTSVSLIHLLVQSSAPPQ